MRNMRKLPWLILFSMLATCETKVPLPWSGGAAAQEAGVARGAGTEARSIGALMTGFYRAPSPELFRDLVRRLAVAEDGISIGTEAPVTGFFAGYFKAYPEDAKAWAGRKVPEAVTRAMANGLALAGLLPHAHRFADVNGFSQDTIERYATFQGGLSRLRSTNPALFDMLWGASFASGDGAYPARVIALIEDALAAHAFDREGLLITARIIRADQDQRTAGINAVSEADLPAFLFATSGIWSLRSNAHQHGFVRAALEDALPRAEGTAFGEVLMIIRQSLQ